MMKKEWQLILTVLFLFSLFAFSPQKGDPVLQKIAKTLDSFRRYYPQEKVYMQLDKRMYYAGERIWFKGYTAYDGRPSTLSRILYADLTNDNGQVVQRKMLPIFGGGAAGSFMIPTDIKPGRYMIKAYTAWMKNFDPAFMFQKDILILNDSSLEKQEPARPNTDFKVQFLPEGGNLVDNLTSFIAFKAIDSKGKPVKITGNIVDRNGQKLNSIKTVHDGMGSFALTARPGEQYFAEISGRGKHKKIPLPQADTSGLVLHVINRQMADSTNNKVSYYIRKSGLLKGYDKLYLVTQMMSKPVDIEEIDFSPSRYRGPVFASGEINTDHFPEGIAQITLFDAKNGLPLAERLIFIRKPHPLYADLDVRVKSFASRGKEAFTLAFKDTVGGSYSVAVTDADKVPFEKWGNNILSQLLLTSDIKGNVYHPGWYFRNGKPETLKALDLLMMTNGWRRYTWKKILNGQYPALKYNLERSIVLRGQAFLQNPGNKNFYKNGNVALFIKTPHDEDSLDNMILVGTDSLGRFSLKNLFFHKSATIYVMNDAGKHPTRKRKRRKKKKTKPEKSKTKQTVSVLFHKNLVDTMSEQDVLKSIPFPQQWLFTEKQQEDYKEEAKKDQFYSSKKLRTIRLKGITVKEKRLTHKDSMVQQYASAAFAAVQGRTFAPERTDFADNALDYIISHVPGIVLIGDTRTSPIIYWRLRNGLMQGLSRSTYLMNAPDFFLNEVLLNDGATGYNRAISRLQMVKVADIALIRVFPPGSTAMAPGGAPHGAVAIYVRHGADQPVKGPELDLVNLKGYSIEKEFYSPDYSKRNTAIPDKRTTLYWNPWLIPDKKTHQAGFTFYNNDSCKKFRMIIEGMGQNGQLVHLVKLLK